MYKKIEANEKLTEQDCLPIISVVSYGEILSFAQQHNWGGKKKQEVQKFITKIIVIDINSSDASLLDAYATIDAYSKGNLPENPLAGSAIKMGKNDLWIAATAKIANAKLLTIDGDFDHLNRKFIEVVKYKHV
ncbi:tRNA(fMet)-specific endonuclease VapC [Chitinophaga niastensis]|uniref:tRNA(fMet)-specific endonuclease VapC n=1 Tax=Chitinophaga niastensis TaxID=536980 RepID=A0A2P8HGI2_CHINA|nr:type II toxin-antitoxin system VapC family toxin [Chitinophaga niastensis]PSL45332.1 tRNA(fMet)-specific endonuclease VapC [Chitinophaga niastensis]